MLREERQIRAGDYDGTKKEPLPIEVYPSTIENTFAVGRKQWEIFPDYDWDELDTISPTAVTLHPPSDYVRGEKTSSWCFLDQFLSSGEKVQQMV